MQVFRTGIVSCLKAKYHLDMGLLGGHVADRRLGFRLYIQHVIMTEGWTDCAIHQGLKGAEVVHHSFLFLPLRSEKQSSKLLKLETETGSIHHFNGKPASFPEQITFIFTTLKHSSEIRYRRTYFTDGQGVDVVWGAHGRWWNQQGTWEPRTGGQRPYPSHISHLPMSYFIWFQELHLEMCKTAAYLMIKERPGT